MDTSESRSNNAARAAQSPPSIASPTLDLEKELSCSICTDILYQPLTVLDCLHTFCGSCLAEWFSWQSKAAERHRSDASPSSPTYTCPSCRATVRDTRPNATVTTLLDMYLQVNPGKVKSQEDRDDIARKYKPGDRVLPARKSSPRSGHDARAHRRAREEEDADRMLVESVSQLSVREALGEDATQQSSSGRSSAQRARRSRTRDGQDASRTRQTDEVSPHRAARQELQEQLRRRHGLRPGQSLRSLEHQSSLRTLMTASRSNPAISLAVQDDILRQINEEGLLDNIDLSNLSMDDEAVISEIIAQAYVDRRQRSRTPSGRDLSGTRIANDRPPRDASQRPPPVSRPHLLETPRESRHRHRRSSSQGSSRSGNVSDSARSSFENIAVPVPDTTAARPQQRRLRRTSNDVSRSASSEPIPLGTERQARSDHTTSVNTGIVNVPSAFKDLPQHTSPTSIADLPTLPAQIDTAAGIVRRGDILENGSSASGYALAVQAPSITCGSCSRRSIQHQLHFVCHKCPPNAGNEEFTLCRRCYLAGVGCTNWYGFGHASAERFAYLKSTGEISQQQEQPHTMIAQRWTKQAATAATPSDSAPSKHESGLFCALCQENSNACYWQCNECNDGEWGFCRPCVDQAKHCTHPLLPIGLDDTRNTPQTNDERSITTSTYLEILPVSTACNKCHRSIASSSTRYHCPTCQEGNYDLCYSCYRDMITSKQIAHRDGPQGWRKCENGHRMQLIGFTEIPGLQGDSNPPQSRRTVIADVVGGWRTSDADASNATPNDRQTTSTRRLTLKNIPEEGFTWHDAASGLVKHKREVSQSYDPHGPGMPHGQTLATPSTESRGHPAAEKLLGMRMVALWTRLPDEAEEDELTFPKRAEISEVVEINENWNWGVYCRQGGMFPSAYCREI